MKNRHIYLSLIGAVLLIIVAGTPLRAQTPPSKESVGESSREALALDFDIREQALTAAIQAAAAQEPVAISQLLEQRHAALKDLVSGGGPLSLPGLRVVPNPYGLPHSLSGERLPLTAPSQGAPEQIARDFLRAYEKAFRFDANEVDGLRLIGKDSDQGAVFLTFNQTFHGINVFRGHVKVVLNPAGQVVHAGVADVIPSVTANTSPGLSPEQATRAALLAAGMDPAIELHETPARPDGKISFRHPKGENNTDITAELVIFPIPPLSARLAYRIFLEVDPEK